ncbi:ABC transporter permease [Nonomuraea sp. FMUSA5-5]|uniref:Transport permease protein n=1 Tax=Nonomuraea composti TaxID=2720023 RepID=A0ABX1B126_9ACTN|nr:ABC transporter permease [Nonomuraea sp. FMUSA5-5]NJP91540.1 ABC transporter permease [Nonomuraea sp. FMUSA5-5]
MKLLAMEAKLHLRDWPTLVFSIGLPVGLLLILGLSIPSFTELQDTGERIVDTHMPSTMALLSLLTLSCSVLPAVLATYRQQGVLRRLSTTPVHPARVLGAQLLINLAVGTVATAVLIVAGWLAFGAAPPRQWAWFVLVFLLGTAAMMALGLVIAALAPSAKAAQGIGSLVMFPLMFLGGVWLPRELMPEPVRVVSDFSVAGPFAQALKDTWAGQPPQLIHLAVVAAGLVVFGAIAVRSFRWE